MNTATFSVHSIEDIYELFRSTGINNPTETQINNTVALLDRTIQDKEAFLNAGVEAVESMRRWRGLDTKMKTIDTVWEHQSRVANMIPLCQYFICAASSTFDFRKAWFMARHHDMTEWLSPFWDIPTPLKQALSPKLEVLFKNVDHACIEILAHKSDSDFQGTYTVIKEILLEMDAKKTRESQVVKYFDLLDAYMMSIHEYGLWTIEFLNRVEWYQAVFQKIYKGEYLPFLQEIQSSKNNILKQSQNQDCSPAWHLIDTKILSTLPIDPQTLIESFAYKLWKSHIARLL
jgi:5'-deoxynucleotidase YfbR-like HD superfamily hydrolase